MSLSDSEGDTIPLTPESFTAGAEVEDVFAWLRPHGDIACEAFDASANTMVKNEAKYEHERQFLYQSSRQCRYSSVYTEDGVDTKTDLFHRWSGAFTFSLNVSPRLPSQGWYLGTNYGRDSQEVDILLAPPQERWINTRIASKHARLFFHPQSLRMTIEARHAVTVTKNGTSVITQSGIHVIEHGELIQIGNCSYTFEYTGLHSTKAFELDLFRWMKEYGESSLLNELLSPHSVGEPRSLGRYYCSPSAFAKGTFGKVSAGWALDGSAVAIKVFKEPKKEVVQAHQQMMQDIGHQQNVVQLLECVSHFDIPVPDAYCVYTPLAVASLSTVLTAYDIDLAAKVTLSVDYLQGLLFLHNKGIMHRDINPNNLAVTSFIEPKGLIIDLDAATPVRHSSDHMQGTVPYLAPEVISLKKQQQQAGYDKSVDIWALGLSFFAMQTGQPIVWSEFAPYGQRSSMVTQDLHSTFHRKVSRLSQVQKSAPDVLVRRYLNLITGMTNYEATERLSAADALHAALDIKTTVVSMGAIVLKSGQKRPRED